MILQYTFYTLILVAMFTPGLWLAIVLDALTAMGL